MYEENQVVNMLGKILLCIMVIAVAVLGVLITEIPEIECSKSQNICSVYTKKLYTSRILDAFFKISDIRGYDIEKYRGAKSTYYTPKLMLKNNNYVYLDFSTATRGRAKAVVTEIIDGMSNNENYTKRGSFLQSLFNWY